MCGLCSKMKQGNCGQLLFAQCSLLTHSNVKESIHKLGHSLFAKNEQFEREANSTLGVSIRSTLTDAYERAGSYS